MKAIVAEELFLWKNEKNHPVSMAASRRKTVTGRVINAVYTPPDYRGRGCASACVAQASQRLLDKGARFCCQFADLSNPTSNSIYQRISYGPVSDYQKITFESRRLGCITG